MFSADVSISLQQDLGGGSEAPRDCGRLAPLGPQERQRESRPQAPS